jgi:hypothetical protein
MITSRKRPLLIVDPDPRFLDTLRKDPKAEKAPPVVAAAGKDAVAALSDMSTAYSGTFVNPEIKGPDGISVIRYSHQFRPATPIFVIHDGECPYSREQLERLAVQRAIPKPVSYGELAELVAPPAMAFDPGAALEAAKAHADQLDQEMTADDAGFVPIRATDFLSGGKSFFDLYVRLSSGKYVKILQAGDVFAADRLGNYLKKGVVYFYLRREAQEHYLTYCDQLATGALKVAGVRAEVKVTRVFAHGEETLAFLRSRGLTELNLEHACQFVDNAHELVTQIEPESPAAKDALKSFLDNLAAYDHGVSASMVASMLAKALDMESQKAVRIVGVSCLLHDIGLYQLPKEVHDEDESKMTPEQKKVYFTHPALGSQILANLRGVDPAAVQAVAQHHERRTKKGFPPRDGRGSPPNRVSEIIGISDEFVRLSARVKKDPKVDLRKEMEYDVFNGFTYPVCQAFRSAFASIL